LLQELSEAVFAASIRVARELPTPSLTFSPTWLLLWLPIGLIRRKEVGRHGAKTIRIRNRAHDGVEARIVVRRPPRQSRLRVHPIDHHVQVAVGVSLWAITNAWWAAGPARSKVSSAIFFISSVVGRSSGAH
jgi:hypothetical protein